MLKLLIGLRWSGVLLNLTLYYHLYRNNEVYIIRNEDMIEYAWDSAGFRCLPLICSKQCPRGRGIIEIATVFIITQNEDNVHTRTAILQKN